MKLVGEICRIDVRRDYGDAGFSQKKLLSLGMDSLMAMELRERLHKWLAIDYRDTFID